MVAMLLGAKRYILSPPSSCPDLGIEPSREDSSYRHSRLDFSMMEGMSSEGMLRGDEEKIKKLKRAGNAMSVETVVKEGEVLYIPSFWFHYITSLQSSFQCNSRSGTPSEEDYEWKIHGGKKAIVDCLGHDPQPDHHVSERAKRSEAKRASLDEDENTSENPLHLSHSITFTNIRFAHPLPPSPL